jgi:hypothetical protein
LIDLTCSAGFGVESELYVYDEMEEVHREVRPVEESLGAESGLCKMHVHHRTIPAGFKLAVLRNAVRYRIRFLVRRLLRLSG